MVFLHNIAVTNKTPMQHSLRIALLVSFSLLATSCEDTVDDYPCQESYEEFLIKQPQLCDALEERFQLVSAYNSAVRDDNPETPTQGLRDSAWRADLVATELAVELEILTANIIRVGCPQNLDTLDCDRSLGGPAMETE